MITLIHGDNHISSRDNLNFLIEQAKTRGVKDIIHLDGKKLTLNQTIQALESTSFFSTNKLVVIETIFSRPQSKEKTSIVKYLNQHPTSPDCIIWEDKSLTSSQLKQLSRAKTKLFKTSPVVFKFLDSLKPQNSPIMIKLFHSALDSDPPELIFYLICRQVRLLLQSSGQLKLPPWQVSKFKRQAGFFSPQKLLSLHHRLLRIDERIKTGRTPHNLVAELELLLLSL